MVKKIDDIEVKKGNEVRVENTYKFPTANDIYVAIHLEKENGRGDRCYMFREKDINRFASISSRWLADKMVLGRIYPIIINKVETNIVKVEKNGGKHVILKISDKQLKVAEKIADDNPEDQTKRGVIRRLTDT